jgi:pilus assembly protein CpaC
MFLNRHSRSWSRRGIVSACLALVGVLSQAAFHATAQAQQLGDPLLFRIDSPNQKLEMTVNTSRILSSPDKIPQAQVNNPDLLELTPLSANQIQVLAKRAGVTQINLWDENDQVRTVDVIIFGDSQELSMVLKAAFPRASLRVIPLANSAILSGYVDRPDDVNRILQISEDFYPKIINSITVGGVQQVLLEVKVMEVSRTRLRNIGFDWAQFSNSGSFAIQSVSGLIATAAGGTVTTSGSETFAFGIVDGGNSFFGVLEAMRRNDLAKVLAEPRLVTVSGRPAFFNAGGEFPIPVPQSLGTISIQYRRFGTQVDFVPIVLGNGNIRLEVRPRVSEIDNSRGVIIPGNPTPVPALRVREIDTAAELRAGQTLALAGLVQERVEAQTKGIPWLMDLPWAGAAFRRNHEEINEIELLIMVTPHLVGAMDCHEVPPCGPGSMTDSPNDVEFGLRSYIEVPRCCPDGDGPEGYGPEGYGPGGPTPHGSPMPAGEEVMPIPEGAPMGPGAPPGAVRAPARRPATATQVGAGRPTGAANPAAPRAQGGATRPTRTPPVAEYQSAPANASGPTAPRARPEARIRNASASRERQPGFIGPTGYDMRE